MSDPVSHPPDGQGPLAGLKVVELAGIGPGPLCATLLSDLGADVIRIDRPVPALLGTPRVGNTDLTRRGRPSISIDLKHPRGIETILRLAESADAILDPFRPGVTEKLGIGPNDCFARNPRIVYGRMTGWGQDGPLSRAAGHDLNYLSLTGASHAIGPKELPVPPLNLVADMGGGAMFLAFGLLAAIHECRGSGKGQVVDVSMVEGSAFLALGNFGLLAAGMWTHVRNSNILDGGAHFYRCYETADGKFVSIAAIEAKFYALLLEKLGIETEAVPDQMDASNWPAMSERFAALFREKTRDQWCAIMEGTDICFAPVLTFDEAPDHPHNRARGSFVEIDGIVQPGVAPRFSRTPGAVRGPPPEPGADTDPALARWGFGEAELEALHAAGAIGWRG